MGEGIFVKVDFNIKQNLLEVSLFWGVITGVHFLNFWGTSSDMNGLNSSFVALYTLMSTFPLAYLNTYVLISRILGKDTLKHNLVKRILYIAIFLLLVGVSAIAFDFLFKLHDILKFPLIPNGENLNWFRNVPEAIINILSFPVFVYCLHWYRANVPLLRENESQRLNLESQKMEIEKWKLEIEKAQIEKDVLTNADLTHTLMGSFFLQTDGIKEVAETLDKDKKARLEEIVKLQENIGKLQRFRYSLIVDNCDLVLIEYELKALKWMQSIIESSNSKITFVNDFEHVEDGRFLIVPNIMSELLWNAFKHSHFKDRSRDIQIVMEVAIDETSIKMYLENPIGDVVNHGTKSGLATIHKRLDMGYGAGNYKFSQNTIASSNSEVKFVVQLELPVKKTDI